MAADAASNLNDASSDFVWTYDGTAPTIGIQSVSTDQYVNAAEVGGSGFTVTGTSTGAATSTIVTVSIGGISETGSTDANGDWTLTMCDDEDCSALTEGLVAISADISDAVGNDATTATVNFQLDLTAPTITISTIDSITDDNGESSSDFITNDASSTVAATLSTTLANDETLQISVDGGSTYSDVAGADITGTSVSTAVTLSGTSSIVLRVSDTAGNTGSTTSQSYTLDTTDPEISSVVQSGSAGDGYAIEGETITLAITMSEDAYGLTCTFFDGGDQVSASMTGSGSDSWTATHTVDSDSTDGDLTWDCSAGYTDLAGNSGVTAFDEESVGVTGSVTIDVTDPVASPVSIANEDIYDSNDGDVISLTFTVSETLSADPTCAFTDADSGTMASASVGNTGLVYTCTVTVADTDASGTVTFSIGFTDVAGNSVTVSSTTDFSSVDIDNVHPTLAITAHVANTGTSATNVATTRNYVHYR